MFSRSRWKFVAVLAAVLVLSVVASWMFVSKAEERKGFIGNVVKDGFQCRFTLSPEWKQGKTSGFGPEMEYAVFALTPSPTQKWMDTHILHRPASALPKMVLEGGDLKGFDAPAHLVEGYPESEEPTGQKRIITHRHLRIDGFPATVMSWEEVSRVGVRRGIYLLVSVRDPSVVYTVGAWTDTPSMDQFKRVDSEMQAIIASFHVEKITGGKRQ